jgi:acetyltransferase EpsM
MTVDLVFIGFGEHATVVADAVASEGQWHVVGYTDRSPSEIATRRAITYLGTDLSYLAQFSPDAESRFVLGLAGTRVSTTRADLAARYEQRGARFARVIHRTAWISPYATVEDGAVILAGAIVNAGARIGRHAIVNTGAIIEHDVDLGPLAVVAPGAVVGGGASLGDGSYIGLGARVRDHTRIGKRTMVAMGAAVVADVADDLVVAGIPAKPRGTRATE